MAKNMNKLLIKTGYRQGMRKGKVFMKCPKCSGGLFSLWDIYKSGKPFGIMMDGDVSTAGM